MTSRPRTVARYRTPPLIALAVGAAWVFGALGADPAAAVVLRYNFQPNQQLVYRDSLALAIEARPSQGERQRIQLRVNTRFREDVKAVNDDGFTLEIHTLEHEVQRVDSNAPDVPAGDAADDLPDATRLRMSRLGRITDRETLGEEDDSAGPGFATPLDEFAIVQQVFDALTLPEGDVEPGATWTSTATVDLTQGSEGGQDIKTPTDVTATSTFKRVVKVRDEDCAEIETTFQVPLRTPEQPGGGGGAEFTIGGLIQCHVISYHSLSRGYVIAETSSIGVLGEVKMDLPGDNDLTLRTHLLANSKTVLDE